MAPNPKIYIIIVPILVIDLHIVGTFSSVRDVVLSKLYNGTIHLGTLAMPFHYGF